MSRDEANKQEALYLQNLFNDLGYRRLHYENKSQYRYADSFLSELQELIRNRIAGLVEDE